MLRCKACNAQLSYYDVSFNKSDVLPEQEDLCSQCRHIACNAKILDTSDYAYAHLTEKWINFTKYKDNA